MEKPLVVLGIDPGIATTGYGVVREESDGRMTALAHGVILTPKEAALSLRLQKLRDELRGVLILHQPDHAAVEELFFSRNTSTAIAVGQARGVVLLTLADHGVPMHEYTPMQVKLAVTGYGGAEKRQLQEMVRMLLFLKTIPRPDDAADALAIAITHVQSHRFNAAG